MAAKLTPKQRAVLKEMIIAINNNELDPVQVAGMLALNGISEQQFEDIYELDAYGKEW